MSNRQNVYRQNAEQTKCRQKIKILQSTGYFHGQHFFFPPELDPVLMCDAQCAETNQKSIFDFYLSSYREKFNENWGQK